MSLQRPYKKLHIATCNNLERSLTSSGTEANVGLAGAFWEEDESSPLITSRSIRPEPIQYVTAKGGYSEFDIQERVPVLSDLDENLFAFLVNRKLSDHIDKITIYANEYLLWSASRSELNISEYEDHPSCPWAFTKEELNDPWVRIMPLGGAGVFRFSEITPRRLFEPLATEK